MIKINYFDETSISYESDRDKVTNVIKTQSHPNITCSKNASLCFKQIINILSTLEKCNDLFWRKITKFSLFF